MSDKQISDAVKARLLREAEQRALDAVACVPVNEAIVVLARVLARHMVTACRRNEPFAVLSMVTGLIASSFVAAYQEKQRRDQERRQGMN